MIEESQHLWTEVTAEFLDALVVFGLRWRPENRFDAEARARPDHPRQMPRRRPPAHLAGVVEPDLDRAGPGPSRTLRRDPWTSSMRRELAVGCHGSAWCAGNRLDSIPASASFSMIRSACGSGTGGSPGRHFRIGDRHVLADFGQPRLNWIGGYLERSKRNGAAGP
jgi:hypothetical protein